MKTTRRLLITVVLASFVSGGPFLRAADTDSKKAKPYPLEKCVVSDEKLGEHGKPYVFTNDGQEGKLCCKDCLADFKKDKAKYMKKIQSAQEDKK